MLQGGCHCGAIRYEMSERVSHSSLCHCRDCRVSAGAPVVAWAGLPADKLKIEGEPRTYASSEHARRAFCPNCGTGLFYVNEALLPGMVDVQTATLDDPDALPASAHVQVAEQIGWMAQAHDLPKHQRFPEQD